MAEKPEIKFKVVKYEPDESTERKLECHLVIGTWDDFGFKTSFGVFFFDENGMRIDLGGIRILRFDQSEGHTPFKSDEFLKLDEDYCSIAVGTEYYEMLADMGEVGVAIVEALRDAAFTPAIAIKFKDHEGFKSSLLRDGGSNLALRKGASYFTDVLPRESFTFYYTPVLNIRNLEFCVKPDEHPPTNMHVIIGRNGTGKTRLLSKMAFCAEADAKKRSDQGFIDKYGTAKFTGGLVPENTLYREREGFQNVIAISFSAFDTFKVPTIGEGESVRFNYTYIGLRTIETTATGSTEITNKLKSIDELRDDFLSSLLKNMQGIRKKRWEKTIRYLASDPMFSSLDIIHLMDYKNPKELVAAAEKIFDDLSSGHKIVLTVINKIVELMQEKTLVLFDEPEAYLHPPLLAGLLRSMSEILQSRNAMAIISTHSPVVLQEVPRSCAYIIVRTDDEIIAERPMIETFAQNLGELTQQAFGLEVQKSGYYAMIKEVAKTRTYKEVLEFFGDQIGAEGRAIAFALAKKVPDEKA